MNEKKQTLDLRGLTCPEPVIAARRAFDDRTVSLVEALVDDDVCVNNLLRLARSLRASFSSASKKDHFLVTISRSTNPSVVGTTSVIQVDEQVAAAGASAEPVESRVLGCVLFLSKDTLGQGDEEFSRALLNIFLQTTLEAGQHPRAILLMNSGVRLMSPASQARKVLDDFRQAGCEVLACGLCLDYYKLKDEVPRDQITNMFAICEYLFAAEKIIQP